METWQLQDAKNKFSELVDKAIKSGPQHVTRHGKPAVVVISEEEFKALSGKQKPDFVEFLLSWPKMPEEWFANGEDPFKRVNGSMREIDW